jgi:hypothetical protein
VSTHCAPHEVSEQPPDALELAALELAALELAAPAPPPAPDAPAPLPAVPLLPAPLLPAPLLTALDVAAAPPLPELAPEAALSTD